MHQQSAPNIIAAVQNQFDIAFFADWAGGLLWLAGPSGASFGTALRAALADNGSGYAQLVRDQADTKTLISPFQPLSSAHYALHKRVKRLSTRFRFSILAVCTTAFR